MTIVIKDVQAQSDNRQIELDCAGVSDLRYPITVLDRANSTQKTVASMEMSVSLPKQFKGTHMSRFIELLEAQRSALSLSDLPKILSNMQTRLNAERAQIELRFPYFLERVAPVSKATGLLDYDCWFRGAITSTSCELSLGIRVPVTSLCPCSKEISDYGAHNQRGYVSIELTPNWLDEENIHQIWFEELVEIAEKSGSAPVYPLLKRADERHVTMQAYDNPVFVEDMVRNVVALLQEDPRVASGRVRVVNHESIHNHSAFASLTFQGRVR